MTRKYSSTSVSTTLQSSLADGVTTSMTVSSGTGNALLGAVTLAAGNVDQFTVAIDADTANEEIVFITAQNTADQFTIVRGRSGTSAVAHTAGATVKHVLTSDDLNYYTTAADTAVTLAGTQTLTNKTLTAPVISTISNTGTITLPTATDTLVARTTTDTLTNKTLTSPTVNSPIVNISINAQTGTTYTLVLADNGKLVTLTNAGAITLTVPLNSSVAFPVGAQVAIQQSGAGEVTVAGAVGVTINSTGTKTRVQWSGAVLVKTATNTWTMLGDLE